MEWDKSWEREGNLACVAGVEVERVTWKRYEEPQIGVSYDWKVSEY